MKQEEAIMTVGIIILCSSAFGAIIAGLYHYFKPEPVQIVEEPLEVLKRDKLDTILADIIHCESSGRPDIIRLNGATGILQKKEIYIKEYFKKMYGLDLDLSYEEFQTITLNPETSKRVFTNTLIHFPDFAVKSWECLTNEEL